MGESHSTNELQAPVTIERDPSFYHKSMDHCCIRGWERDVENWAIESAIEEGIEAVDESRHSVRFDWEFMSMNYFVVADYESGAIVTVGKDDLLK